MTHATVILTFIWGLLEAMQSFTTWLNKISVYIFIGYLVTMTVVYIVCIIAYSYKLQQIIKKLADNNDGLTNQHEIDLADKQQLLRELGINQKIVEVLITAIPSENLNEVSQRIGLMKEVYNIDERNEDSKDN
ncbi:hypothetical protein PO148_01850 [Limosilactobacillus mucosae]|jgi:hypothetical protein|uniref:Uncharacterized protein n=2 Tax=Limosilactobacillus mucosae TaxID=97478 RepID=A0A099YE81_LIMMU|nr:hypothetical protein [Limosilactobacillus mucosae]HAM87076.1 hypothetical protein [Lactobacillus sp.]KGL67238.1 hypothetical protein LX03_02820 [Limosilactobacillus mucosae]MDC2829942.1 hypothetical protein [Limosilactobacillus mucosae]MDC2837399.1 hypothetical protein [Limosilactobacillus mucosae]MDC2848746.1 hypothetical protein [Limosilactobacillus mucosae]